MGRKFGEGRRLEGKKRIGERGEIGTGERLERHREK